MLGGLGNQMFQYATAKKMAVDRRTKVLIDLQFYENQNENDTLREYELNNFVNITASLLKKYRRPSENPYRGKKGKLLKFKDIALRRYWTYYREISHDYDDNLTFLPSNTYLNGYWQSSKYFEDIRDELLNDFFFDGKLSQQQREIFKYVGEVNSVSVHIRRGDYITNPTANKVHGTKGKDYYERAVREISKTQEELELFVISDDLEWCKKNIKFNIQTTYVDVNSNGYEDMWLMSLCKHNIIANSSFSWWAAWLNKNSKKIVIAPKVWFNDLDEGKDRIPAEWLRV